MWRLPCYVRVQQIPIISSDWLHKTDKGNNKITELWERNIIIYIFIYIYYLTLPLGNDLSYFLKQKIIVPSSVITAVVRQSLPAKQWLTETRRVLYYQFVM